jgi:phosphonatase-like hydrolase
MIQLVVFDLAGTTVYDGDSVNNSLRAALAGAGVTVDPAVVNVVMGLPKPEAIRRLLAESGRSTSSREIEVIHGDFVERMRDHYAHDRSVREIEGAAQVFATLRRAGVKVALNTGFNRDIVSVLLRRLGWSSPEVIDSNISSDEVPRGRPHADMIRALMARLGVGDARRVAKVGDTSSDLEEGTNAGCGLVIGVTSGVYRREELLPYPHTHLIESVAEVPGLVLAGR